VGTSSGFEAGTGIPSIEDGLAKIRGEEAFGVAVGT
jgi:hypothetical protein